MPVFSLPSRYGIGSFSKEAYEFVDFLKAAGQSCWQVLPMGPTSYGDSPYQSFSSFAGNPYFIDLETLGEQGLLSQEYYDGMDFGCDPQQIDYVKLHEHRGRILRMACEKFFRINLNGTDFLDFCRENNDWLTDYALFMVLKDLHEGKCWTQWEDAYKNRDQAALKMIAVQKREEIRFYCFEQYLFDRQWKALHAYAAENGISIIGDVPIYVALDSADAWAQPELFQFDEARNPKAVAGCPPDAFTATGQLWGNPLYDWPYHKKTGYAWWVRRVAHCLNLFDTVRIDHFRGFESYYSIPAEDKTAEFGHWEPGPGMDLMNTLKEKLGEVSIIAEDLGFLTDSVRQMLADSGFPGMKVLQFAFDAREESDYLPHNYEKNSVVYTGTHDNDTTRGWYETMSTEDRALAVKYMNNPYTLPSEISWDFIRLAMASVSDLCVIPMQDYLCLGSEARINTPSTLGDNWKWRMLPGCLTDSLAEKIRDLTELYGRGTSKFI